MATVFVVFDSEGEVLTMTVIPEDVNLETVRHYSEYSYAQQAFSVSEQDVEEAVEFLAQVHALDVKNGVKA